MVLYIGGIIKVRGNNATQQKKDHKMRTQYLFNTHTPTRLTATQKIKKEVRMNWKCYILRLIPIAIIIIAGA